MFLDRKIQELKKLRSEVPAQAKKIVLGSKERILDLIREDQLFDRGIDGKGVKLREYKPFTVAVKRGQGKPTDRTTLNETGAFYRGFDLLFTDQYSIGVFSRDVKTPDLVEKYGADIFTFTVENNKIINEEIITKGLIEWLLKTPTFIQI